MSKNSWNFIHFEQRTLVQNDIIEVEFSEYFATTANKLISSLSPSMASSFINIILKISLKVWF